MYVLITVHFVFASPLPSLSYPCSLPLDLAPRLLGRRGNSVANVFSPRERVELNDLLGNEARCCVVGTDRNTTNAHWANAIKLPVPQEAVAGVELINALNYWDRWR